MGPAEQAINQKILSGELLPLSVAAVKAGVSVNLVTSWITKGCVDSLGRYTLPIYENKKHILNSGLVRGVYLIESNQLDIFLERRRREFEQQQGHIKLCVLLPDDTVKRVWLSNDIPDDVLPIEKAAKELGIAVECLIDWICTGSRKFGNNHIMKIPVYGKAEKEVYLVHELNDRFFVRLNDIKQFAKVHFNMELPRPNSMEPVSNA